MPVPQYAVVDLFAGPGGLAEGFSRVKNADGSLGFQVALSVEKDEIAHQTLRLRAFLRQFGDAFPQEYYEWIRDGGEQPHWHSLYAPQWAAACREAMCLTLGEKRSERILKPLLEEVRAKHGGNTIVIGGPPCQAYSLVGRARNSGKDDYIFEKDHRHALYKAYVAVLARLQPAAFVMENVKGLLSSRAHGELLFNQVLHDLRAACGNENDYELLALTPSESLTGMLEPRDFVIRAERHGIPQARHRVIIVGIRRDVARRVGHRLSGFVLRESETRSKVRDVLHSLPPLRSGLSREDDSGPAWRTVVLDALKQMKGISFQGTQLRKDSFEASRVQAVDRFRQSGELPRSEGTMVPFPASCPRALREWFSDSRLKRLPNHETRGHIRSDLARYVFASVFAAAFGRSPKAGEFPEVLAPEHANWNSGLFADRFKVQVWDEPSSTVTSHISKDGHYYIHPDPAQCRSLTVREAARLQCFPDNYVFLGNRTQQYVQIGNAVPPFLAHKIGSLLLGLLGAPSRR